MDEYSNMCTTISNVPNMPHRLLNIQFNPMDQNSVIEYEGVRYNVSRLQLTAMLVHSVKQSAEICLKRLIAAIKSHNNGLLDLQIMNVTNNSHNCQNLLETTYDHDYRKLCSTNLYRENRLLAKCDLEWFQNIMQQIVTNSYVNGILAGLQITNDVNFLQTPIASTRNINHLRINGLTFQQLINSNQRTTRVPLEICANTAPESSQSYPDEINHGIATVTTVEINNEQEISCEDKPLIINSAKFDVTDPNSKSEPSLQSTVFVVPKANKSINNGNRSNINNNQESNRCKRKVDDFTADHIDNNFNSKWAKHYHGDISSNRQSANPWADGPYGTLYSDHYYNNNNGRGKSVHLGRQLWDDFSVSRRRDDGPPGAWHSRGRSQSQQGDGGWGFDETEYNDIHHPNWAHHRSHSHSAHACFRTVRDQWCTDNSPDPHRDLTFRNRSLTMEQVNGLKLAPTQHVSKECNLTPANIFNNRIADLAQKCDRLSENIGHLERSRFHSDTNDCDLLRQRDDLVHQRNRAASLLRKLEETRAETDHMYSAWGAAGQMSLCHEQEARHTWKILESFDRIYCRK